MMRMMVDIETLDVGPSAAIWQIGWAFFDLTKIIESGIAEIDVISSISYGGTVSLDTVSFTNKTHTPESWERKDKIMTLYQGLNFLAEEIQSHEPEEIWANSPSFDCVILRSAFSACGIEMPWKYGKERDVRTLRRLIMKESGIDFWNFSDNVGIHTAEFDSLRQAQGTIAALGWLRGASLNRGAVGVAG